MKAIFRTLLAAVLCMAAPHALAQGFVVNLSDGSQMLFPLASVSNVSIYGTGQEQISVSASSLTLNADDAMKTVTVTTNVFAYAVSVSESWLTVTTAVSTSGNKYISVGAEPNHGTTARTATITLTAGAATATVNVTQNAATVSATKSFTVTGNGKTVTFNMKLVEAGTFQMGRAGSEDVATPVHQVTLTKDYYMGETEVTQALWYAVMGQKPTSDGSQWESTYGLGDNYPAYRVSWDDCQTFITKLNALTGATFRLPTEAEWEFAAKGGKKSQGYTYAGSNTIGNVAWYEDNSSSKTHEVATKAPNELGLYDMSGNVWEWCQDWYGSYSSSAQTDPTGPSSGSNRVLRGGYWDNPASSCRVKFRFSHAPGYRNYFLGLRLVL